MTLTPTNWPSGGSAVGPSVGVVGAGGGSQPDLTTLATHGLVWSSFVDNLYDFNTIGSLPAGLGLTIVADSATSLILTTAAGVWTFTALTSFSSEANYRGNVDIGLGMSASVDPRTGSKSYVTTWTLQLPAAAQLALTVSTTDAPSTSPYRPSSPTLAVTRLA